MRSPSWPRAAPRRTCPAPTTSPPALGESDAESRAGAEAAGLPWDAWKVRADLAVIALAWERRLPLLGVCGGMQAMVGVRRRDAARRAPRTRSAGTPTDAEAEAAEVAEGTLAAAVLAGGAAPNSYHRQVVDRVSAPLTASVRAADGVIEAVEAPRDAHPFWLGLQWHPELLGDARPFRALAGSSLHAERVVAGGQVAVVVGGQRRLGGAAHVGGRGAAGMEAAAARRVDRVRHLALHRDAAVGEHQVDTDRTERLAHFLVGQAERIRFFGKHLGGNVFDVVAGIAVVGCRLVPCRRDQRVGEPIDLGTVVIEVVLANDTRALCRQ